MPQSDPVADMICRIKNAYTRRHKKLSLPYSRLKEGVAKVLLSEGYVEDVKMVQDEKSAITKTLFIWLKYDTDGGSVISEIRKVSKPGRRVYRGVDRLEKVLDGLGVSVLSTSKGILSDRQARKQRIGGELLCRVW